MIIGLTGGSGTGKSTLSDVAKSIGFYVIDADKVGHDIIKIGRAAYNDIVDSFGKEILLTTGEIDRKALGNIVFSDPEKLELLNKITHKRIEEDIDRLIRLCGNKNIVLDAALLYESGMNKKCDYVIAVNAPIIERIERICYRDSISPQKAVMRINSQHADDFYSSKANKTIYNGEGLKEFLNEGRKAFEEALNAENQ